MKRFHIALGVSDIEATVRDYTTRIGDPPVTLIAGAYALWRTTSINLFIRKVDSAQSGLLRHLGWKDDTSPAFSCEPDVHGILWERFTADQHQEEIKQTWPSTAHRDA